MAEVDESGHLAAVVDAPADLVWAKGIVHHITDQQAALTRR